MFNGLVKKKKRLKFDRVIVDVSGAIKPDFDLLMQQYSWLQ